MILVDNTYQFVKSEIYLDFCTGRKTLVLKDSTEEQKEHYEAVHFRLKEQFKDNTEMNLLLWFMFR